MMLLRPTTHIARSYRPKWHIQWPAQRIPAPASCRAININSRGPGGPRREGSADIPPPPPRSAGGEHGDVSTDPEVGALERALSEEASRSGGGNLGQGDGSDGGGSPSGGERQKLSLVDDSMKDEASYNKMVQSVNWEMYGIEGVPPFQVPYARAVPVSPSYFSRLAHFNESYLRIENLLRSCRHLPITSRDKIKKPSWKTLGDYSRGIGEDVPLPRFNEALRMAKRLYRIKPELRPQAVNGALRDFLNPSDRSAATRKATVIDKFGRALGMGRRKTCTARAWVVEGTGEVLINGKSLSGAFGRVHDRESATWPLRVTERMDKYNVWALVDGGGTTGQAEALILAIARALLVHEPGLKNALRRAGCLTRDPRAVERKKPGHRKSRKMPAWVKR